MGCTQCKKQLDTVGSNTQCLEHGVNNGKRVYAAQILLANVGHQKDLPVWEERLNAMVTELMRPGSNLDIGNVLEQLLEDV